jgi:hypothetical protein
MSEIIELYFELAYRIIGRLIYGNKFSNQYSVPLYIKAIAGLIPILALVFVIWIVIMINN